MAGSGASNHSQVGLAAELIRHMLEFMQQDVINNYFLSALWLQRCIIEPTVIAITVISITITVIEK